MEERQRAAACCAAPALLLLLLPCVVAGAGVTLCALKIEGHGPSKPGVKNFQLSCSGGSIMAFAHPILVPHLANTSGVSWLPNACGLWARGCLLAICGDSTVTFAAGTVVQAASPSPPLLLCVGGLSALAFQGARFFDNAARSITGFGPDVSFLIKGSSFTNNSLQSPSGSGGAVSLEAGGSAVIEASTFTNNTVLGNGGAISVGGTGSIKVVSSLLQGNTGAACWQPPAWSGADRTRCPTVPSCPPETDAAATSVPPCALLPHPNACSVARLLLSLCVLYSACWWWCNQCWRVISRGAAAD